MPRIRTIKPEFWTDDAITECSTSARLLFVGMWNFADDSGNIDRSPKQMKARIFPHDAIDVEPLLVELLRNGLIVEYMAEGKIFLHIKNFQKHQKIDRKSKPTCPAYDDSLNTRRTLDEHSTTEGKGREGKGSKVKPSCPNAQKANGVDAEFEATFWPAVPYKIGKGAARKAYRAARKKTTAEQLLERLPDYHEQQEERRRKSPDDFAPLHPATWLNQERWEDETEEDKTLREDAELQRKLDQAREQMPFVKAAQGL